MSGRRLRFLTLPAGLLLCAVPSCSTPCEDTLTCDVGEDDEGSGVGGTTANGIGTACSAPGDCGEGSCIDGFCCASSTCDGVCLSCDVPGSEGQCSATPAGTTDDTCDGLCDGRGSCATGAVLATRVVGAAGDQYAIGHNVMSDGSIPIGAGFDGSFTWASQHPAPAVNSSTAVGLLEEDFQPAWSRTVSEPMNGASLSAFQADPSGAIRASGPYNGTISVLGQSVTAPPGSTAYIAAFNPSGTLDWIRNLTTAGVAIVFTLALGEDGSTYLGGLQGSEANYGDGTVPLLGPRDGFIVKYDPAGNLAWKKSTASAGDEVVWALTTTAQDELVAVGNFDADLDFGGGTLSSLGTKDVFLVKYDADGNHLWSRSIGQSESVILYDLATDAVGNIVAVGQFNGTIALDGTSLESAGGEDVLVMSFDALGNLLWARNYGNFNDQTGRKAAFDANGNIFFTGFYTGSIDFGLGAVQTEGGLDSFIAKLAADGTALWSHALAGPSDGHRVEDVAVAPDGSVVVTGWTSGEATFGGEAIDTADGLDIFMARLAP